MTNCPLCGIGLLRVKYEGLPAYKCDRCKGHLLDAQRLEGIERNRETPVDRLTGEAREEYGKDSEDRLECPRCGKFMTKVKTPPPAEIYIDTCDACKLVWLDGGELAVLQIQYEISEKGEDQEELKKRVKEMRGRRRKDFEENLARLPDGNTDILGILGTALVEGAMTRRWRRFEKLL